MNIQRLKKTFWRPVGFSMLIATGLLYLNSCNSSSSDSAVTGGVLTTIQPGLSSDRATGMTCNLLSSGTPWCWGNHAFLGNAYTFPGAATPLNFSGEVAKLAGGWLQACAILHSTGALECYGYQDLVAFDANQTAPWVGGGIHPAGTSGAYSDVSVGHYAACAVQHAGTVQCWGKNDVGQLGNNSLTDSNTAVSVVTGSGALTGATHISLSHENSACALLSNGTVDCWGWNGWGNIGSGTSVTPIEVATPVSGITTATQIVVGNGHACALLSSGNVQCWGNNANGELGNEATLPGANQLTPVNVTVSSVPLANVTQIAAGGNHTCALQSSGEVMCWGYNANGEVGYADGTTNSQSTPQLVVSTTVPIHIPLTSVAGISASEYGTCALLNNNSVTCWGKGANAGADTNLPVALSDTFSVSGAPAKLSINLSGSIGAFQIACVPVTVSLLNGSGTLSDPALNTSTVTANLSGNGTFYSDIGCTSSITSTSIASGSNSAQVYYFTNSPGTLSAADNASVLTTSNSMAIDFDVSND